MNQLETLLNTLIQRGWKPKDREVLSIKLDKEFTKSEGKTVFYCDRKNGFGFYVDLRWLVSLESGLWQFVCSHLLIGPNKSDWLKNADIGEDGYITSDQYYTALHYQYRLLESALVPEDKLAQFLVDNIQVEGKKE